MLMPTVRNAQAIAAKTDANWVRVEIVILMVLSAFFRVIPVMPTHLQKACQFR